MNKKLLLIPVLLLLSMTSLLLAANEPTVEVVKIKGPINPIISQHVIGVIDLAEQEAAQILIIEIDTPGGLESSMRQIVQRILNSKVPIVAYVTPSGARAASAGAFIMMAADITVMAQGTTMGAAHPVEISGAQASDKVTNDAAALMRTIAEKKNRNINFAEEMVTKSVSLTETEALANGLVDMIAADRSEILAKVDGRRIEKGLGNFKLETKNAKVNLRELDALKSLLHNVIDPNIVYILLIIGFYGIIFELSSPGISLGGIIGGICIILALYGLGSLPVNYAGLFLIIFGVILFILDIKAPTHGILTFGGIAALTLGSFVLFKSGEMFIQLSKALVATMVITTTALLAFMLPLIIKAQRRRASSGAESLINVAGEAKTDLAPKGIVHVAGEDWYAESLEGQIKSGEKIRVVSLEGLIVKVKKER